MAATTDIAWTDCTFNFLIGCRHATYQDESGKSHGHPGCLNCYAEAFAKRTGKAQWGEHGTRNKTSAKNWQEPLKWNLAAEAGICRACNGKGWLKDSEDKTLLSKCDRCENTGKIGPHRRKVFCASLGDVFEEWDGEVTDHHGNAHFTSDDGKLDMVSNAEMAGSDSDGYHYTTMGDMRAALFNLIDATPSLDWQVLTKRPQNIVTMWPVKHDNQPIFPGAPGKLGEPVPCIVTGAYRENVWLMTSISDQATANALIPHLFKARHLAPVLGVSAEPLMSRINFNTLTDGEWNYNALTGLRENPFTEIVTRQQGPKLDWVIIGGESGGRRRDCGVEAIVDLAGQCKSAGTSTFVKQDCNKSPGQQGRIPDSIWSLKQFPEVSHANA